MQDIDSIKKLVHDQYVLNFIMTSCRFWSMRICRPAHELGKFKIKLYKHDSHIIPRKSTLMDFNDKGEAHVYVSRDYRFGNVASRVNTMNFSFQYYDLDAIVAKSLVLDIIKKSGGFKWKSQEFLRGGILEELLVKADIEESTKDFEEEDSIAAHNAKSTLANDVPF